MRVALQTVAEVADGTPLVGVLVFADDGARGAEFDAADAKAGGLLSRLLEEEGFEPEPGKTLLVHTGDLPAKRHLLIGAGKAEELEPQALRGLVAAASDEANQRKLKGFAFVLPAGVDAEAAAHFATLGATLGNYRYQKYLTKDVKPATCEEATLIAAGGDATALECAVKRAEAAAAGVCFARDLVNGPPVEITPLALAAAAEKIAAEDGLECTVLDKAQITEQDMNLLLAVSAGSDIPPRFIHLVYRPDGADESTPQIALVGKGITYDAGGYNLKPTGALEDMKIDMGGAAAVLGAMRAVSGYGAKYVVHGIVPTCENLVSGGAYKPGDVFHAKNGKSVEIMNTDAEGRLILADALSYTAELDVDRVVDLATLTGACMVALGPHTAGLFANDDDFRGAVKGAGDKAGEDLWPMPLTKKLKGMLDSPIADMKNVGQRWGGAITAGLFLQEFVGDKTWAHLDIAGPASTEKPEPSTPKGGTGFGVLTLLELVNSEV